MQNKSFNKIIIVGNVGGDPEKRVTPSGLNITKFSVATTESFNKDGNWENSTEWFNCVAFNKTAEIASKILFKGATVIVEGRIKTNKWTNKEGVTQYSTEVHVSDVILMNKKNTAQSTEDQSSPL